MRLWRSKIQKKMNRQKAVKILTAFILAVFISLSVLVAYGDYVHFRNPELGLTSQEEMDFTDRETVKAPLEEENSALSGEIVNLKENEGMDAIRPDILDSVLLTFAGDVLMDGWVDKLAEEKGMDYVFAEVKSALEMSDVTMVNLENPISTRGTKAENKEYTFRADPLYAPALHNAGINIVTLANNHILDFGLDALKDTLSNLDKNQLLYTGAGLDVDSASKPVMVERKGIRLAFLGSSRVIPLATWAADKKTPGVAVTYNPERLVSEISKAKKQADVVIVYVHWGEENSNTPAEHQKQLARLYIDAGADVVVGAHPHVLQGFEFYKGKIIAYSLGNFVFGNLRKDTMLLNIRVDKDKLREIKVLPCEIRDFRPIPVKEPQQSQKILKYLQSISFGVSINDSGIVTENTKSK